METYISNMLFDYGLNLENLCITQFVDLLQRTRRTTQTMRTKRVPVARREATESLISIAADSGMECFTAESHASQAYLETTNAITFTNEDMEVEHLNHRRPPYMMATINGVQVKRALVDTGASLNLIALSTLEVLGLIGKMILGAPREITRFGRSTESTEGYVQLALKVGPIVALTRFHVINSKVSYHVLLGRP